jgi:hypothetical protein
MRAIQALLGRLKEITLKAQITINIIKIDKPEIMVNSIEIVNGKFNTNNNFNRNYDQNTMNH